MKKIILLFIFFPAYLFSQSLDVLSVEKIMRDPKWIGTSPANAFWSSDSRILYFSWNPEAAESDSLYQISTRNHTPQKVGMHQSLLAQSESRGGVWNSDYTQRAFISGTVLYVRDIKKNELKSLIETTQPLSQPRFVVNDTKIAYRQGDNLYAIDLKTGSLKQLTNFKQGKEVPEPHLSDEEAFLQENALENSVILQERKEKAEHQKLMRTLTQTGPAPVYTGTRSISSLTISPDGETVFYQLTDRSTSKGTIVPDYVTISGHTEDINSRAKVGAEGNESLSFLLNLKEGTPVRIEKEQLPGIRDIPAFFKEYPDKYAELEKEPPLRKVSMSAPVWSSKGTAAFITVTAQDHKDRWIMELDLATGELNLIDRQHDEAWIGGPGISGFGSFPGNVGWIDEETVWFQSEESGYSHLYTYTLPSKKKTALTKGNFEVQAAQLSRDRQYFYLTTNEVSPGETNFYQLRIKDRKMTRITQGEGGHQAVVSPDGKYLAVLHSTSNHPWELYLQENKAGAKSTRITHKAETAEFQSYPWRKPEIFTFTNRDGDQVYAEVYKPEKQAASRPGVIFVHGAGYLQDVKNAWSDSYFREHMFMNLLADNGYTVMNIDYRASAGYGRDWRTAIYRHMGKNDLNDNVDGAKYMVDNFNVNPENIGLWGGSYGGFLTLMALFTTDTFAAGGALRSVTDWAHYNHGYTSNILNRPQDDPIAYKQSSPIYFADGLKGSLLMPHGMVDTNVHFQDIVRLTQKLIELGKDNWELAVYPVENHGFVEPSSWVDEYKRIFKLFEDNLK